MSLNLNYRTLVYKNKDELLNLASEVIEQAQDGNEDELYEALEALEQITYTLKNCNYEGKS